MYRDLGVMTLQIRLQPEKAKKLLLAKYRAAGGSATGAGVLLGCSAQTFFRWTEAVGISKEDLAAIRATVKEKK